MMVLDIEMELVNFFCEKIIRANTIYNHLTFSTSLMCVLWKMTLTSFPHFHSQVIRGFFLALVQDIPCHLNLLNIIIKGFTKS